MSCFGGNYWLIIARILSLTRDENISEFFDFVRAAEEWGQVNDEAYDNGGIIRFSATYYIVSRKEFDFGRKEGVFVSAEAGRPDGLEWTYRRRTEPAWETVLDITRDRQ